MPDFLPPDEGEEYQQEQAQVSSSALAILNQSEHAAMVQTANLQGNRRKLADFEGKLMAYANHSQAIAISMFYSLPRGGKQIIGASVRFAEIVAPCWKNCAVAARVIGDAAATVTGQGVFLDYENNHRNAIEVPRRITDKDGKRYGDDMIVTTMNAAMSIARRNAVLKGGVPQALWSPAYDAAQLTAVGKAASHAQRVADAMEYLHKLGVTEWQILNAVGVPSPKELETEHLVTLKVLLQEIRRGEKTIEQVFGSGHDKEIDALFAQLKMNNAQQTMLKNSYMGRADQLVDYLRERLGPVRTASDPLPPAPVSPSPQPAPPPAASPEPVPVPPESIPPPPPVRTEPAEALRQQAAQEVQEQLESDIPSWAAHQPLTAPPPATRQQTTMEPKRRGRPTREEAARKAAQGSLIPENEQQARQETEEVLRQTDQFDF